MACSTAAAEECQQRPLSPLGLPPHAAARLPSRVCLSADLTRSVLSPERGAKPVTSFVKNLSALSDWYSVYTSAIAFTVSAPGAVGMFC